MMRSLRMLVVAVVLVAAVQGVARAQGGCLSGGTGGCSSNSTSAPEVDPSLGTDALALLGGVVLVVRSRRRA